jgi:hypothetical protein
MAGYINTPCGASPSDRRLSKPENFPYKTQNTFKLGVESHEMYPIVDAAMPR